MANKVAVLLPRCLHFDARLMADGLTSSTHVLFCVYFFVFFLPFSLAFAWFECIPLNRFSQHHRERGMGTAFAGWLAGMGILPRDGCVSVSVSGQHLVPASSERKWFLVIGRGRAWGIWRMPERYKIIPDPTSRPETGDRRPSESHRRAARQCSSRDLGGGGISAPLGKV